MSVCDLLVLGDGGLAGRAILQAARSRGMAAVGASRSSAERTLDVCDDDALRRTLDQVSPACIVNTVAIVSVAECERAPERAWRTNARPAAVIAERARHTGSRVVHISTDHFFSGDGQRRHGEDAPVRLLNDYARTKYAAEAFALTYADTVVLRANMVGLRSATGASFGEWALDVIDNDRPATLFGDQYVSMLDVWSFAEGVLDIAASSACGVVNLASSDVFSKAEFVTRLAAALGRRLTRARWGAVGEQAVARPDSLGLDVSRAEALLGRRLPGLDEVVAALALRHSSQEERRHALAL